jgi:hypothetical protein
LQLTHEHVKHVNGVQQMLKMNKMVVGVIAALGVTGASAGTFQTVTSESVGVEAATVGALSTNIAGDSIVFGTGTAYAANDRIVLTLSNGATFADSTYRLEQSAGGAGTGDLTEFLLTTATPAGSSSIEFRAASAVADGADFILTGSAVAGQAVTFNVASKTAGTKVEIDAEARDVIGVYDNFSSLELFRYANEFSAAVDTVANAVVDVNEGRLKFTGAATTDQIAIDFTEAAVTNGVTLTDDDKVVVTLSGNMAGIASVTATSGAVSRGNATIDAEAGTAVFEFSASDLAGGTTSAILDVNVDGTTVLATREYTIQADLDFESETDKNLVAADTAAGAWTINGLQAKVSHMSLNVSGFISWLKVMNTGTIPVQVYGDIIYTLADGTEGSVEAALLGAVDAGGVGTVSEATLLAAMGNPTQLADVHITVTVTGQDDAVHLIAEKKASDGRLPIPVYYDNTSGRSWFQ